VTRPLRGNTTANAIINFTLQSLARICARDVVNHFLEQTPSTATCVRKVALNAGRNVRKRAPAATMLTHRVPVEPQMAHLKHLPSAHDHLRYDLVSMVHKKMTSLEKNHWNFISCYISLYSDHTFCCYFVFTCTSCGYNAALLQYIVYVDLRTVLLFWLSHEPSV